MLKYLGYGVLKLVPLAGLVLSVEGGSTSYLGPIPARGVTCCTNKRL